MNEKLKALSIAAIATYLAVEVLGPLPALAFFAAYPVVVQILKDLNGK